MEKINKVIERDLSLVPVKGRGRSKGDEERGGEGMGKGFNFPLLDLISQISEQVTESPAHNSGSVVD